MVTGQRAPTVGNAPAESSRFVGRRSELTAARRLLEDSRLVTLTGPGGVGKTRLALRLARHVARTFANGVWFVDLARVDDPDLLDERAIAALNIQDQSTRLPRKVLTSYLADRHLLLVLDNCEHVAIACQELIDDLLRAAPNLRVVTTSRVRLGCAGEQVMEVPPLAVPSPSEVRGSAPCTNEALALFVDRAQSLDPAFHVEDDVIWRDLVSLCRQLEGVPLAIELAAARTRMLSPGEMLRELNLRGFGVLDSATTTSSSRASLHAALMWSYQLCSRKEQLLWDRLSVFSDGFDLPAAEAVCAGEGVADDEVLDLVQGLVDSSVVQVVRGQLGTRYRQLELVREFGFQQLTRAGEHAMESVRQRHCDYYAKLAHHAARDWFGARELVWLRTMQAELGNIEAAANFCLDREGLASAALKIAVDTLLTRVFVWTGQWSAGSRLLTQTMGANPQPSVQRDIGSALHAWIALLQGDHEPAKALLDSPMEGRSQAALAAATYVSGCLALLSRDEPDAEAIELFDRARAAFERADETGLQYQALLFWAIAQAFHSDTSSPARQASGLCQDFVERFQAPWALAWANLPVAVTELRFGSPRHAVDALRGALPQLEDRWGQVWFLQVLWWALTSSGEYRLAAELLGAADNLQRSAGLDLSRLGIFSVHTASYTAQLREHLNQTVYTELTDRGRHHSYDQILALALGSTRTGTTAGATRARRSAPAPLTDREWEVAQLAARGGTNKSIAATLVVSRRTAESHIEHALSKLGFRSRAELATWVTQQLKGDVGEAT